MGCRVHKGPRIIHVVNITSILQSNSHCLNKKTLPTQHYSNLAVPDPENPLSDLSSFSKCFLAFRMFTNVAAEAARVDILSDILKCEGLVADA